MSIPDAIVEKAARAMAVADGRDPDDPAYVQYPGPQYFGKCWRDKYAEKARVALTAVMPDLITTAVAAEREACITAISKRREEWIFEVMTEFDICYEQSLHEAIAIIRARSNTP